MNTEQDKAIWERLAARLDALEDENAQLRAKVAALGDRTGSSKQVTVRAHGTQSEEENGRTSRRGMIRTLLGVAAATASAGVLLETQRGTALADGTEAPTTFSSDGTLPAVVAEGAANIGVIATSADVGVRAFGTNVGVIGGSNINFGTGVTGNGKTGVHGFGAANGVWGETSSANDSGVFGRNNSTTRGYGVSGFSANGTGVFGNTSNGTGVYGFSANVTGVVGQSNNGTGVSGASANGTGVKGLTSSSSAAAMQGDNFSSGPGVNGTSVNGIGVSGSGLLGVSGTTAPGGLLPPPPPQRWRGRHGPHWRGRSRR